MLGYHIESCGIQEGKAPMSPQEVTTLHVDLCGRIKRGKGPEPFLVTRGLRLTRQLDITFSAELCSALKQAA
jgi:hypothetical protein